MHNHIKQFLMTKNFSCKTSVMAMLGFALLATVACSKQGGVAEPAPQNPGGSNTNPPETVDTSNFKPQQTGISFRKVTSPKSVTDYLLQIPATYNEKKTTRWPVIIFLHGVGGRGSDLNKVKNEGLAAIASRNLNFPYIVVSPQCKDNQWWDVQGLEAVYADVVKLYNVDTNRIYITGLSMGGYGTWDWASSAPGKFAAAVPICGGGAVSKACALKNLPVWAFHNADDPTVNVNQSREMVKAVKDCGGTLIKYTENPTGGHDAWTKAYNDPALYTWLNQQTKK